MGILDAPAPRAKFTGRADVAWLGDSLTANGSTAGSNTGQYVGTVNTSAAASATTLVVDYPYTVAAGFPNTTPPGTGVAYVIEPGTAREELFVASAVSGTGPYTLTVPALTFAHAAGVPVRNLARKFSTQSIPTWAAFLSNSRMRFGGIYAHGSYTTAQIESIYLPMVLAKDPKPWACVVQVGTNDSWDTVSALPSVKRIITALRNAGILPIVCSAQPPGSQAPLASSTVAQQRWNDLLHAYCADLSVPFVDITTAMTDPTAGGMKATYSIDNTHPGPVGAKVWAQTIVNAVSAYYPVLTAPMTPMRNVISDATVYPFNSSNALMLTDSNTDGVPDGWTVPTTIAGLTTSLVAEPGLAGNMLKVSRPATTNGSTRHSGPNLTFIPGHKYRMQLWIKTAGLDAAYDAASTTTAGITGSSFQGFSLRLFSANEDTYFSLLNWVRDLPLGLMVFDFIAPNRTGGSAALWVLDTNGTASTPAYSVQIQPWLIDLTALGA